jgi:hypothetical protein
LPVATMAAAMSSSLSLICVLLIVLQLADSRRIAQGKRKLNSLKRLK